MSSNSDPYSNPNAGKEPEYSSNYDTSTEAAPGGGAEPDITDLAGVDESLFLDEDLPDDDDLE